jgi:hypothetical protein
MEDEAEAFWCFAALMDRVSGTVINSAQFMN